MAGRATGRRKAHRRPTGSAHPRRRRPGESGRRTADTAPETRTTMARRRTTAARRSATPEPDGQWVDASGRVIDEEDRGLVYDVRTLVSRRSALGLFGALGAGALVAGVRRYGGHVGVGRGLPPRPPARRRRRPPRRRRRPRRGAGRDRRALPGRRLQRGRTCSTTRASSAPTSARSFGSSTTTAEGVPLTVRLTVRDAPTGSALEGAAVYLWHCDRDGGYSLYAPGLERRELPARRAGHRRRPAPSTFTSIFPACYSGRWPHIHFEVYSRRRDATSSGPIVKTSQIALPQETCDAVYATSGY